MVLKKQDKQIIEKIVSGSDRVKAYREVYPESTKSEQVIRATVCRMIKKNDAQEYKKRCEEQLKKEKIKIKTNVSELIQEKIVWSIQIAAEALLFVITKAKQDCLNIEELNKTSDKYIRMMPNSTATPIINAVSELNKLYGLVDTDTGENKSELTNQFIDATDFSDNPEDYKAPPILEAQTGGDDE